MKKRTTKNPQLEALQATFRAMPERKREAAIAAFVASLLGVTK